MKVIHTPILFFLFMGGILFSCTGKQGENYRDFQKIDAHTHLRTTDTAIIRLAEEEGFRYLSICTRSDNRAWIDSQLVYVSGLASAFPDRVSYLTTFSMEGFEYPGWAGKVIGELQTDLSQGAIGVKIWKDIGMTFRYASGEFVFLDDPLFQPVFEYLQENGIPVLAHIGEPRNCWLPIDSMTVNSDKSYYREHPQYHMYLHPDYPTHDRLMESRDHVLARFPGLRMIGAHLGSLEWDVDVLAERLDRFPNFAVDMAARICHFQVQDREKVREFILRYQDRLLYGTDLSVSGNLDPANGERWQKEWQEDWAYFATGDSLDSPRVNKRFRGLDLDREVLEKIYYTNALQWYPGLVE